MACVKCRSVHYCSGRCQASNWSEHKSVCDTRAEDKKTWQRLWDAAESAWNDLMVRLHGKNHSSGPVEEAPMPSLFVRNFAGHASSRGRYMGPLPSCLCDSCVEGFRKLIH
mmetsp:Transcript_44001/g.86858  ORF Transcript_44001/g.86858 Transcript_44001/m.86858 type:complete len:111 (+) Transcript_44001:873-1205(+)